MAARGQHVYAEDMFADTRMSFGDHIEELRAHMLRAIYGFLVALLAGFAVAPFVLDVIQAPVREQLRQFHAERAQKRLRDLTREGPSDPRRRPRWIPFQVVAAAAPKAGNEAEGHVPTYQAALVRIRQVLARSQMLVEQDRLADMDAAAEQLQGAAAALGKATDVTETDREQVPIVADALQKLAQRLGDAIRAGDTQAAAQRLWEADDVLGDRGLTSLYLRADPLRLVAPLREVQEAIDPRDELVSLSILESCMAYLKVSVVCGLVLASPWIFFQMWSFVAAGLYPHERRYVNLYLPLSIVLFLGGVLMAQFYMMPKVVEVLLWFNRWLGQEPVLRLSDWLSFALLVPALTGLCFELPVVMLFLERAGLVTTQTYIRHWKAALFIVHVVAAVGPAVDPISMEIVALPMFALYWLGILMCKIGARAPDPSEALEPDEPLEV